MTGIWRSYYKMLLHAECFLFFDDFCPSSPSSLPPVKKTSLRKIWPRRRTTNIPVNAASLPPYYFDRICLFVSVPLLLNRGASGSFQTQQKFATSAISSPADRCPMNSWQLICFPAKIWSQLGHSFAELHKSTKC